MSEISLNCSPPHFMRQGLWLNPELADLTKLAGGQVEGGNACPCLPRAEMTGVHHHAQHGKWELKAQAQVHMQVSKLFTAQSITPGLSWAPSFGREGPSLCRPINAHSLSFVEKGKSLTLPPTELTLDGPDMT